MAEVVRAEFHIDVSLGTRFFILFKALGHVMHVIGKGAGYLAFTREGNGLILYLPVTCVHGLRAVALDDELLFVPSVIPLLVLIVVATSRIWAPRGAILLSSFPSSRLQSSS
jgi:hypothetical protein